MPLTTALAPGLRLSQLLTLTDQTDETGRLLLEDSAPKQARRQAARSGVTMRTATCTYSDSPSRAGGLMNVSAYEALRADLTAVLDGFAWLSERYLAPDPAARGSVLAFFDLSYLGISLPLVLFHRGHDPVPPHGSLPSPVASIYKASRGMVSAAVDQLNRVGPAAIVDAAGWARLAESGGHLRRPQTRRVCAAPTRLIERTIAAMLTGLGADAGRSDLAAAVDFPTLRELCRLQDGLSQALSTYGHVLGDLLRRTGATRPAELLGLPVRTPDGRQGTFGDLSQAVVVHANSVQAGLNRVLGREETAAAVTLDEVVAML